MSEKKTTLGRTLYRNTIALLSVPSDYVKVTPEELKLVAEESESLTTELQQARQEIAARDARIAELEGVVERSKWIPINQHPDEFYDGDGYLLLYEVHNRITGKIEPEYHIVYASCDSETPVSFKVPGGDMFDAWDFEDAEAYIKLRSLPHPISPSDLLNPEAASAAQSARDAGEGV